MRAGDEQASRLLVSASGPSLRRQARVLFRPPHHHKPAPVQALHQVAGCDLRHSLARKLELSPPIELERVGDGSFEVFAGGWRRAAALDRSSAE